MNKADLSIVDMSVTLHGSPMVDIDVEWWVEGDGDDVPKYIRVGANVNMHDGLHDVRVISSDSVEQSHWPAVVEWLESDRKVQTMAEEQYRAAVELDAEEP